MMPRIAAMMATPPAPTTRAARRSRTNRLRATRDRGCGSLFFTMLESASVATLEGVGARARAQFSPSPTLRSSLATTFGGSPR
jgi:hypothetical protein